MSEKLHVLAKIEPDGGVHGNLCCQYYCPSSLGQSLEALAEAEKRGLL